MELIRFRPLPGAADFNLLARFDEAASRPACRFPRPRATNSTAGASGVTKSYFELGHQRSTTPLLRLQMIAMASMRDHASRAEWDAVRRRAGSLIAFERHIRMNRGALAMLSLGQESIVHLWVLRLAHEFQADADEIDRMIAFLEGLDPPRGIAHLLKEQALLVPGIVAFETPEFIVTDPETWAEAWEAPRPRGIARELRSRRRTTQNNKKPATALPVATVDDFAFAHRLRDALDDWDFLAMNRRAALVGLRIERFHRTHGRWPDTLEEALPDPALADIGGGMVFVYDPTPTPGWSYQLIGPEGLPYRRFQPRLLTHDRGPAVMPKVRLDDE